MALFGKRTNVRFPFWHDQYLYFWCYVKGQQRTSLIQNIVQARIEANAPQIDEILAAIAQASDCTLEEMKERILKEAEYQSPIEEESGE